MFRVFFVSVVLVVILYYCLNIVIGVISVVMITITMMI